MFNHISETLPPSSGIEPLRVLMPIYDGFNTFDFNGPVEVLCQANRMSTEPHFKITVAAEEAITKSIENIRIDRDISLEDAIVRVKDFDVLLLAGGTIALIRSLIEEWKQKKIGCGTRLMTLLDNFMSDPSKLVLTVCTAALFLGSLGRLDNRVATTHWVALTILEEICCQGRCTTHQQC